ncbi:hypothetical protein CHARACLAT_010280 [Characodon lateralis]|uniref:Uncharacterized protein n=1 Tax=Characodon lateralis TaxID=208331 RepID=A0ABU7EHX1_9TELE|nr:hypothetical protein [Characodon lateralis]
MRLLADEPCPASAVPHLVPSHNFGLSLATVKDLPSKTSPQHFPGPASLSSWQTSSIINYHHRLPLFTYFVPL